MQLNAMAGGDEAWTELGRALLSSGDEVLLRRRSGQYEIRFNGRELMSNRAHRSEAALGIFGCEGIRAAEPCILIGGLGMGYTLRAVLDVLPASASVIVAELLPEVIAWNHGPIGDLAGRPLADRRVSIAPCDVTELLARLPARFDAILLDVDNGPDDVTFADNRRLYSSGGLSGIRGAIKPAGRLAVWAAERSTAFETQLTCSGFDWQVHEIAARGAAGDPKHAIYLGTPRGSLQAAQGRNPQQPA